LRKGIGKLKKREKEREEKEKIGNKKLKFDSHNCN
jgi:hypothetical protein